MKTHSPGFLALVNAAKSRVQECMAKDVVTRVRSGEALLQAP